MSRKWGMQDWAEGEANAHTIQSATEVSADPAGWALVSPHLPAVAPRAVPRRGYRQPHCRGPGSVRTWLWAVSCDTPSSWGWGYQPWRGNLSRHRGTHGRMNRYHVSRLIPAFSFPLPIPKKPHPHCGRPAPEALAHPARGNCQHGTGDRWD